MSSGLPPSITGMVAGAEGLATAAGVFSVAGWVCAIEPAWRWRRAAGCLTKKTPRQGTRHALVLAAWLEPERARLEADKTADRCGSRPVETMHDAGSTCPSARLESGPQTGRELAGAVHPDSWNGTFFPAEDILGLSQEFEAFELTLPGPQRRDTP